MQSQHMLAAFIIPVLSGSPIMAQDNMATSAIEKAVEAGFSDLERQLIEKYIGKQEVAKNESADKSADKQKKNKGKKGSDNLPPGLAKRDSLPSGLEKQLQKNGTLPPGLAKRSLPADLERDLPPVPQGYERQMVEDGAVVLVHKASKKIVDVILGGINDG